MYYCEKHINKSISIEELEPEIELCDKCEQENGDSHEYKPCFKVTLDYGCAFDNSPSRNQLIYHKD